MTQICIGFFQFLIKLVVFKNNINNIEKKNCKQKNFETGVSQNVNKLKYFENQALSCSKYSNLKVNQ